MPQRDHPFQPTSDKRKLFLIVLVAGLIALASGIAVYKQDRSESGPTTKAVSAKTASE